MEIISRYKDSDNFSSNDLEVYKEIIMKAKAFFQDRRDQLKSNRGNKYKDIIKSVYEEYRNKIFNRTIGTGVIFLSSDSNELVLLLL